MDVNCTNAIIKKSISKKTGLDKKYLNCFFGSADFLKKGSHFLFGLQMLPSSASKLTLVPKKFGIQTLTGPQDFQLAYVVMSLKKFSARRPSLKLNRIVFADKVQQHM